MEKCHEMKDACEALSKNTAASGIFMHNAAVVFIEQDCTRPGHHTMQTESDHVNPDVVVIMDLVSLDQKSVYIAVLTFRFRLSSFVFR